MEKGFLYENIDLVFKILVWGVIGFVVLVVLLKYFGVIHSPSPVFLESSLWSVILIELVRIEYKLGKLEEKIGARFAKTEEKIDLIWSDFKKRKKL